VLRSVGCPSKLGHDFSTVRETISDAELTYIRSFARQFYIRLPGTALYGSSWSRFGVS
jgi:hypothetical protein